MASGSTAPFSGEFVDLENVPKLPEGISAEQVLEQNSDVIRQAAEARFNAGLSQTNADGGFFDAFVDNSKVASSNNIKVSTKVLSPTVLLQNINGDNFEDGVDTRWSGDTSRISAQTNNVLSGSQSGRLDGVRGQFTDVDIDISTTTKNLITKLKILGDTGNNSDSIILRANGNGSLRSLQIEFFGSTRNIIVNGTDTGKNWEVDKKYIVEADFDYSNNTVTVFLNGEKIADSFNLFNNNTESDLTNVNVVINNSNTFVDRDIIIDDVGALGGFKSSGTVTEQQFTFTDTQGNSFSPSKVGIFPDQNLNGQSITYDLKDSTGTVVKTFNQSDLNQLQSVNTTDTTFQVEANLSGNGSQTPELEFLDVRGV